MIRLVLSEAKYPCVPLSKTPIIYRKPPMSSEVTTLPEDLMDGEMARMSKGVR